MSCRNTALFPLFSNYRKPIQPQSLGEWRNRAGKMASDLATATRRGAALHKTNKNSVLLHQNVRLFQENPSHQHYERAKGGRAWQQSVRLAAKSAQADCQPPDGLVG
ncbi:hypothetical protein SAMN06273570_2066 [Candidatus Pantoea floridensis]|uniref:Uncharacterized protein n=1 Tax=Candidatus Pantoea floridensis TaxID=1938870 RepID=A0A286BU66_9GAMM|nr:hypothetical protein BX596_4432 [Enterobacteriaceae bacterium JKS000233]SOD37697.1 hypothetical protein SAMN06273570_2066 [Pantoea floridensis]